MLDRYLSLSLKISEEDSVTSQVIYSLLNYPYYWEMFYKVQATPPLAQFKATHSFPISSRPGEQFVPFFFKAILNSLHKWRLLFHFYSACTSAETWCSLDFLVKHVLMRFWQFPLLSSGYAAIDPSLSWSPLVKILLYVFMIICTFIMCTSKSYSKVHIVLLIFYHLQV